VRRVAPRVGEARLGRLGLALIVPGFLAVGTVPGDHSAHALWQLYGGLALLAFGSALVVPCLSALASRYAPADRQGLVQGTFRGSGSLARALGPLLGGLVYWSLGSAAPYVGGAVIMLVPLFLALRLPPPPVQPAAAAGR
jgi:MFS family permease